MEDNKTIDMEINADTTELDEAIDKAETLQEALERDNPGAEKLYIQHLRREEA